MNNSKQSMAKSGNLNPMFGKRHSTDTKKKISDSQKQRYETIRKALKEQELWIMQIQAKMLAERF